MKIKDLYCLCYCSILRFLLKLVQLCGTVPILVFLYKQPQNVEQQIYINQKHLI